MVSGHGSNLCVDCMAAAAAAADGGGGGGGGGCCKSMALNRK